ncbi:uncharacterized protein RAG0_06855 [Rhynchosporium agropyri]|uniref:Uncharacterized protein n=1 Tax=Rhynchosporium agropyri TaxID=914238 RepID=A0A1E1KJ27_9HELO|nr:uncharacterized protein RAG0_06855 [Rhynchosporium agropyri]
MATPTLIGMPDPPSNPETPTEMPGTPNSTTTSLSALSTTAIKDGHRGSAFPHTSHGHRHTNSSNEAERERADRISFLAGLERVSTARPNQSQLGGAAAGPAVGQIPGYFDQNGNPVYTTKMSTVGSASATGSAGGRTTTWASGSTKGPTEAGDEDQMSMDAQDRDIDERDRFSASAMDEDMDGMSDNASLVGFGEGAGSTVSGPIYSRRDLIASPPVGRSGLASQVQSSGAATPSETPQQGGYADGSRAAGEGAGGVQAAERIMRDRLDGGESRRPLGSPDEAGLGKFYFEEKK